VHLLIYLIPLAVGAKPAHPFLNSLLIAFSNAPLFGPLFYGIFAFYLLMCVIKGCIKFGLRVLFIPIHPIKSPFLIGRIGGTMMNSMVFNVGLILLSSLAVVQFCSLSFKEYARYTSIICKLV
jgi:LMBR1 domain-containing protein 1